MIVFTFPSRLESKNWGTNPFPSIVNSKLDLPRKGIEIKFERSILSPLNTPA
jgi:hypothetical protein